MWRRHLLWTLLLLGLNLFLIFHLIQSWWPAMTQPELTARPAPSPPAAISLPEVQPLAAYKVIVEKNLFSSLRQETDKPVVAAKAGEPQVKMTLVGTIIIGSQRAALISTESPGKGKGGAVEILRPGETWQDYQVLEVKASEVTLAQNGKKITLSFPEEDSSPSKTSR